MSIVISGTLNDITVDGSSVVTEVEAASPSTPAPYHIYNGQVSLTNSVTTTGFSTTLYTGNGATQSITTGVDMDTQWGNDASEKFGGLVWLKSRSATTNNFLFDTLRGTNNEINSNTTEASATLSNSLTSFNSDGFSLGGATGVGTNAATYASWNFQTTHRRTGVTNHGKAYTEHYNPFTGFTMVKYEGSGLAGHEIPHSLGRKLGFVTVKNLSIVSDWLVQVESDSCLKMNLTDALVSTGGYYSITDTVISTGTTGNSNGTGNSLIMYGWANSYFDEANTLIGNYEIGTYQGTGASGNKVKTRGKPAWVMVKMLSGASQWVIVDNIRTHNNQLYPNLTNVETAVNSISFVSDGFVLSNTTNENTNGSQYLYMVVYDNDSGSGKSKYPRATDTSTLNLNAHVPFANGVDTTGNKVSIAYKNETITLSNALVQGKNYIALLNDGTYVANSAKPSYGAINPASGDFFNLYTQKWYSNLNVEITPRNYLDCVVYADQNGQPEYVEQLTKTQYISSLNISDGFDLNQKWVDVTAIRENRITYTNSTGKPIMVHVTTQSSASSNSTSIILNGVSKSLGDASAVGLHITASVVIPHGHTYSIVVTGSAGINSWLELR